MPHPRPASPGATHGLPCRPSGASQSPSPSPIFRGWVFLANQDTLMPRPSKRRIHMNAVVQSNPKSKYQWALAEQDLAWRTSTLRLTNSTPNRQNSSLCQLLVVTHKACLSCVSSLLLPVPVPMTAMAIVVASNPPSLA